MENEMILSGETCCDTVNICDCDIETQAIEQCPCKCVISEEEHLQFVQLAATLQDSVLHAWRLHLKAKKYSSHVILEEYYDEAFDIIDGLIEHYQGICKCDIINKDVISCVSKIDEPCDYFTELKQYLMEFVNNPNNFNIRTNEIKSDIDDLLRLIDSTLYKLSNLTESKIKSFRDFVKDLDD